MKTAARLVVLLLLVLLAGCGSAEDALKSTDGGGAADSSMPAPASVVPEEAAREQAYDSDDAAKSASGEDAREVREASLIQRGNVSLEADDVSKARIQAQAVAAKYDGEVTESESSSNADGKATFAHLVLRVPAKSFSRAMADLEAIGTLRSSSTNSEDVTTQVIDTEARVKVQKASIERIRTLLSAAKDIGDVVRIESELSRREAELDSLLQQQSYLGDQTSRSTITLDLSPTGEGPTEERDGFLGGLERGWDGLVGFTSGVLLALGVLVPWLPLIAIAIGVGWWGLRRLRSRRDLPA